MKRHLNVRWRAYDGQTLNAGLVALWFSGDPDKYWYETLYFCDFSGGGGLNPLSPPSGPAHAMAMERLNASHFISDSSGNEYFTRSEINRELLMTSNAMEDNYDIVNMSRNKDKDVLSRAQRAIVS